VILLANTRFILPNSADTSCELWLEGQKVEIKFFSSTGKNLGVKSFLVVAIKEDDIVNHLASSEVNFTTFSALYDGATLILNNIKELKESGGESARKIVLRRKSDRDDEEKSEIKDGITQEEPVLPTDQSIQPLSFETRDLGKIIHHMLVPYTKDVYLFVFQITKLSYTLIFEQTGEEIYRSELKGIPEETDVYPVLQKSGLQAFDSMSVVFDVAESISKCCKNADSFSKEVPQDIIKRVELSKDLSKFVKKEKIVPKPEPSSEEKETKELAEKDKQIDVSGSTYLFTFKVPYSESSVDFLLSGSDVLTIFKKEEKEVSRNTIVGIPSEDEAYAIVDKSGISDTFSSMSLIYTVSEKIIEVCTDPKKFLPKIESKEEEQISETSESSDEIPTYQKLEEEAKEEVIDEETLALKQIVESGSFITELKIPYSHETSLKIYLDESTGKFALLFWRDNKQVDLKGVDKSLNEDGAWEILNSANIQFISMSVIYDAAENILKVISNPDDFRKVSTSEDSTQSETYDSEPTRDEDDQAIDFDKYKKPEDIENLLEVIKKSLGKSKKPILVMESEIKTMPKVGFKVFRQAQENWMLDFYSTKDGATLSQRPAKLKAINSDEVFKAVNNGIPQVTLSAVSDAAEYVYEIIKHLADRPADDLAFNQVVTHFAKLIDEHEKNNEINEAIELTEGLINKLADLKNASGFSKFGLRLAKFYESQERSADSAKHRLDLIPKLIAMKDLQSIRDFVDDTVELFSQKINRPLDAAQVSVDFAEVVLKRKDLTLAMKYIKQASVFYKEANISRALADHNFRFSKLYLQLLRDDQPEGFYEELIPSEETTSEEENNLDLVTESNDPFANLGDDPFQNIDAESEEIQEEFEKTKEIESVEEKVLPNPLTLFDIKEKSLQTILDDTVELFKETLGVFEASREQAEKIDALTEIILLYRRYQFLNEEIIFADLGVDILKENGQADRALRLALQSIDKLLVKNGDITKGLEFFNDAIKIYYEKHQVKQALDLAVAIVPKLISFGEKDTTLEYVGFTSGIIDRIFPQPVEEALPYYLKVAQFYSSMKKQQESLALLGKTIIFKQTDVNELLEFCHEYSVKYLETKDWDVARDFINSALNVIGTADYPTIQKVSYQFFKDLCSYGNYEMGMQYLTYSYQLTGQLSDPLNSAGNLIIDALKHFLSLKKIPNIKDYINPLLPIVKAYYTQTQQYLEVKKILEPIIERYIENENWTEAVENAKDLSTYLQYGQQLSQASEILVSVRNKVFNKVSKDIVREFTDTALKLSVNEYPETQDKGVEILEPYIEYLLQINDFSDAYIYTVQAVKYYESQKKIFEATEFIKDKQAKFADKNRHQDVNSLSDLIIRLNKQSEDLNTVADIAYSSYKENLSTKNWEACYGYLRESSTIYLRMGDDKKAEELLLEAFDIFIKEPNAEDETEELINELAKFNKSIKKFSDEQLLDFYKSTINKAQKSSSFKLMNKMITKTVTLVKETFSNRFYDEITEIISNLFKAGLYKDSQPYVSELITSYSHDLNFIRDLLFYYIKEFLIGNEVEIAQKLVELVLEKSKNDSGNVIRITMRFVQMLAEYRLSGQARAYIDKIVQNLFPTTSMDQTQTMAVATIYDKFATMVGKGSPELAIEYGYKAADLYKKVLNFDKMIEVYTHLVTDLKEEETIRSVLKRGTTQADQIKIPFHKQYHLHTQLAYKNFETRAPTAEREFVQILGRLEKESMLKEAADYLQESFYRMIRANEFDLFFKYIDYLITLVGGLKTGTKGQKILVQIAARYYNKKKDKGKVAKLKTIYDSINEDSPSDELLSHFLKTGGLELPPEPIKPTLIEEMKEVVQEVQTKVIPIEAEKIVSEIKAEEKIIESISVRIDATPDVESKSVDTSEKPAEIVTQSIMESKEALKEIDKSAASLEDELLEIGGDALSKALADAISQLTAVGDEEEEMKKEIKQKEEKEIKLKEKEKSKAGIQSGFGQIQKTSSSMDLSNFDSLSEIMSSKKDSTPRTKETKSEQLNPNDSKSLESLFSNALNELSNVFGTADISNSESDVSKDKKDKKGKKTE
jgi:hypothetical protein